VFENSLRTSNSDREAKTLVKPAGCRVWVFRAGEQANGLILSLGSAEVCGKQTERPQDGRQQLRAIVIRRAIAAQLPEAILKEVSA